MTAPGGAGLYVHVPFCSAVCPYCDFAVRRDDPTRHEAFVETLLAEAAARTEECAGETIDTVYLGGGTPTALSPALLGRLLEGLAERLPLAASRRLHLEANPEDVTPERLAHWRDLDLHFLSLGIQSVVARELRFLGRRHDGTQARVALAAAMDAGIPTVSCDLIFGLPDQTEADLDASLGEVAAARPGHVSGYQLTIEPRTPFGRRVEQGRWAPLPDGEQGRLFGRLHEGLEDLGYEAYEVSNFRRDPDQGSAHNQKYWDRRPYVGLGPSAHSFDGRRRSWNHRDLDTWSQALHRGEGAVADREVLATWDLIAEVLMLGFRRPSGVDVDDLKAMSGYDLRASGGDDLDRALAAGTLRWEGSRLRPTRAGLAVADALASDLCPEPPDSESS